MTDEDIFLAAVEKPPAERAAYLDAACGPDAGLRARVEGLLRSHDEAGSLLEQPLFDAVTVGMPSPAGAVSGAVGPYKLLQQIGEGGMGAVWLAEQAEPVRRRVAVKLAKVGTDPRVVLARFEAERQALALMDHPNIARVLDAGATPEGRPYFVMELVKGVPITRYCDDHRLTPRQRLELFVQVCHAVQHAHQKGVIHRDLKPSNVMVAPYDGRPVVKVIDFGIAKATGMPLTEKTLLTGFGAVIGTPEYMSPEQAELNNADIDTRSDVYSLGVLLYELLTGTTPLTKKRIKEAALAEVLRLVREEEPPTPSTRLSSTDELPSIAANRGLEPKKLSGLVRGELDWIVMRALEKDRNRRYETANAFGQDVQRYLADEHVLACPPSAGYRLGKFLRRNKRPVLAAALILLALFAGGIGAVFGLTEARKQREVTSLWQQAEVARGEAEAARDGEAKARREAEAARERLAAVEYGRTMQVAHQEWRDNNILAALALLESTRADLRGWEWRYVHRLCHSHLLALDGHASAVLSASFSPDGSRVVTGSEDKTAKVWDARTGAELLTFKGHTGVVLSAAFSPDGARVVTAGHDPVVRVWDARTGADLLTIKGHTGAVLSVAFSRDGARVVTGGHDRTARVWDAKTGAELLALKGHTGDVWSAAFNRDGTRVVTAGDTTARVWDATTGVEVRTFRGHAGVVLSAAFSPDGARVITGGWDKTAGVWDVATGVEVLALNGHTGRVTSASFSPDGARVVTGSHDRTARVWDAKTGAEVLALKGHTREVASAAFSPDGARVVTGSGEPAARVWDARAGTEFLALSDRTGGARSAAFGSDGSRVVTGHGDSTARVWDARTGAELLALKGPAGIVASAAFSPDGSRVVTGTSGRNPKSWDPETGAARVWDAKTGAELLALNGHTGDIWSAAFSADGTRVVTGSADRTGRVWDAWTGAGLVVLQGHASTVWSAAFGPDGSRVVTGSGDNTARVWDAKTGAPLVVLTGHTGTVYSAAFSADGARVVTGSADRTARVWDAKTGAELLVLRGHTGEVQAAAFGPDGSRVVTGSDDNTARVWDARTGAEVLALKGHAGTVRSASFSPDGSRLVTGGGPTARVWNSGPVR